MLKGETKKINSKKNENNPSQLKLNHQTHDPSYEKGITL
jgi:hypothetical protein